MPPWQPERFWHPVHVMSWPSEECWSLQTGWFGRGTLVLPAVVASPTPGVVASVHPLIEVGSMAAAVVLVAEATRGRRRCVARAPGVDRGFSHESGSHDAMLRGVSLPSGGRNFGPSDRGILQEILELSPDTPPSVVDGSGIAQRSIAAATRFWPTPLEAGGGLALTSSAMRSWMPWGR
jgi:hypothetical protein